MGGERRINLEIFVRLLRDVITGGVIMGDPGAQGFWSKFADVYNSKDAGFTVTANSCEVFWKSLRGFYNIMTNPPEQLNHFLNPEQEQQFKEKSQMYVDILAGIYKNQPSLCPSLGSPTQEISSSSGVPEISDMVVWNKVQSSGFFLKAGVGEWATNNVVWLVKGWYAEPKRCCGCRDLSPFIHLGIEHASALTRPENRV